MEDDPKAGDTPQPRGTYTSGITTNCYDFLLSFPHPDTVKNEKLAAKLRERLPDYARRIRAAGLSLKEEETSTGKEIVFLVGTIPAIHPRTGEHYEPLLEDTADRLNIPMPHRPDADGLGGGYVSFKKELREEFLPEIDRDGERVFFGPSTRQRLILSILTAKMSQNPNQRGGAEFDIKHLHRTGFLKQIVPLHDAVKKANLIRSWGNLGKMFSRQPLDDINEYFGPKVAMYFAWIGYYTFHLWLPTLLGLIVGILSMATQQSVSESDPGKPQWDNVISPVYAFFMIIWATIWNSMWKRYSSTLADRWGQYDSKEKEEFREDFVSRVRVVEVNPAKNIYRVQVPVRVRRHSGMYEERYFPRKSRWCVMLLSVPVIGLLVGGVIVSVYFTLTYRDNQLKENGGTLPFTLSIGLAALNAAIIIVFNMLYKKLAVILNNAENYRTEAEYENALIIKTFMFQFVNSYISLYFIAFVSTQPESGESRMQDLFTQLLVILFLKQIIGNLLEVGLPWLKTLFRKCFAGKKLEDRQVGSFEREMLLSPYESTFNDYLEIVVQFGYMTMFSVAFPFGPVLSLLNNLFEIRLDARRLLSQQQRPIHHMAVDIGAWQSVMEALVFIASVSNSGLIAFVSSTLFTEYLNESTVSSYSSRLAFIILEHILIFLILAVKLLIHEKPVIVRRKQELKKFSNDREFNISQGYLEVEEDDDDDDDMVASRSTGFQLPGERPSFPTENLPRNLGPPGASVEMTPVPANNSMGFAI